MASGLSSVFLTIISFLMLINKAAQSAFGDVNPAVYQQTVSPAETKGQPNISTGMEALVCLSDFYDAAKSKLTPNRAWEHIEGGVDDEFAVNANRKAYRSYYIRPRFLRNVSQRNLTTSILGKLVTSPVGVSPTGTHKMVHPEGELSTVKGAGRAGSILILSCTSSYSIEDVAKAAKETNTRLWFQLEMLQDYALNRELVTRAEKTGFEALVLTVDAQYDGKNRPSLRQPFHGVDEHGKNLEIANFKSWNNSDPFVHDTTVTWDVVKWIRDNTKMKLVMKGILTAEDAAIAVERGVDAIIVSNHGGRMLDCTLPTIDALPEVVAAVPPNFEVYLDGGIMQGSDVFKALALGARMVFIGRASLWGLAVGGEQGVTKVLEILKSELDLTMAISGIQSVRDINQKCLHKYSPMM